MARVFIPPQLRDLTSGAAEVSVNAATVRALVSALDERFPGIQARIQRDNELAPGIAVCVDGVMLSTGLLAKVQPHSEVHFLPALSGG